MHERFLQRVLYLRGIDVVYTSTERSYLRPIAYEMPLYEGNRVQSIDLVAYDVHLDVWLIELKRADSADRLDDIVQQITGYATAWGHIKNCVQQEFRERFHSEASFQDTKLLIVAPRAAQLMRNPKVPEEVLLGYLGHIRDGAEAGLLNGHGPVSIHVRR
jgi:hypothetical protein